MSTFDSVKAITDNKFDLLKAWGLSSPLVLLERR